MPRPPKHVPADTLGGRIRAARETMHLSLAEVAAGRYSTSLISQIERNRVDPSIESLQFLSERLQLPLDELTVLIQQKRESESDESQIKHIEEVLTQVSQLNANNKSKQALALLEEKGYNISQLPKKPKHTQHAAQGQSYFDQRQFLNARKCFQQAEASLPDLIPDEQKLEVMTLHLHLASSYRELEDLNPAFEHYKKALSMMDQHTQFGYVAEAQWGLSLVAYSRAAQTESQTERTRELQIALEHAENACVLSRSIGGAVRAASLTCLISIIKHTLGRTEEAKQQLNELLSIWEPLLLEPGNDQYLMKERASIVSAAACALAEIELEQGNHEKALADAQKAWNAGVSSYILRRADAKIMIGRILEAKDRFNPAAEEAFRDAVKELEPTDRIAARVRAHDYLGRHLLKKNDIAAGEKELERAFRIAKLASTFNTDAISAEDSLQYN